MIRGTKRSLYPRRRRSWAFPAVVVAALLLASGLVYFHLRGAGEESPEALPAPESSQLTPSSGEPLEAQPGQADEEGAAPTPVEESLPLPALDESDALVREMAEGASARPELRTWLQAPDLIRRMVAGVANVADGESPRGQLTFLKPREPFRVVEEEGRLVADPRSYARYDVAADVFASLDVPTVIRAYRLLQPLFEQAYAELGLTDSSFEETLGRAIAEILGTPRVEGAAELRRVAGFYEYADQELEGLSLAQRHLLRMGPRNALRIQAKLREIQRGLGLAEDQVSSSPSGADS
jgi:hypothetical protein